MDIISNVVLCKPASLILHSAIISALSPFVFELAIKVHALSNYSVDACFLASRYFQLKDLLSQYDLDTTLVGFLLSDSKPKSRAQPRRAEGHRTKG